MGVFFASWLVNMLCLYILARFVPGITIDNLYTSGVFITQQGFFCVAIGGLIMGFFNSVIRPVLKFISFPLTCLTLGLFSFVVTGLVFYVAAMFIPGMHVANFWWAILGGVLFGILNSVISGLLGVDKDEDGRKK